jgi:hypothetical protein
VTNRPQFGVEYIAFVGHNARMQATRKWFKTEKARAKFCGNLEQHKNFIQFTAFFDSKELHPEEMKARRTL